MNYMMQPFVHSFIHLLSTYCMPSRLCDRHWGTDKVRVLMELMAWRGRDKKTDYKCMFNCVSARKEKAKM